MVLLDTFEDFYEKAVKLYRSDPSRVSLVFSLLVNKGRPTYHSLARDGTIKSATICPHAQVRCVTKYRHCDGYVVFKVTDDYTVRRMLPLKEITYASIVMKELLIATSLGRCLSFVRLILLLACLLASLPKVRFVWFCGGV